MNMIKRWGRLLSKVNGLSTPMGGVQWVPPPDERVIAKDIISYLEDRRVLYAPHELEMPRHCFDSVQEIRKEITSLLKGAPDGSVVDDAGKAIRAACRHFIDRVGKEPGIIRYGFSRDHWASWIFMPALGEFRAFVGAETALLAEVYELPVSKEIKSIFPPERTK